MPVAKHVPGQPNKFRIRYTDTTPVTIVYCPSCERWVDTSTVHFLNIEEGDRGQDRMTFRCGHCGKEATSDVRRG